MQTTKEETNKLYASTPDQTKSDDDEIEQLVQSMTRELAYYAALSARQAEPKPFIIHKLHERVKSVDPTSYQPSTVSLGPYHNGTKSLQGMEREKYNCLDSVRDLDPEQRLDKCLLALEDAEKLTRLVYSEEITMDGNSFIKMMLLDACYILCHILGTEYTGSDAREISKGETTNQRGKKSGKNGWMGFDSSKEPLLDAEKRGSNSTGTNTEGAGKLYRPWCTPYVVRDLLLLENQIPFFVIEKIYESMEGEFTASALREKTVRFVQSKLIKPYLKHPEIYDSAPKPKDIHHLLHLCHSFFKPMQHHKEFDYEAHGGIHGDFTRHLTRWRRATQYEEVGIKLRKKQFDKNNPHSLLDITFKDDVMEVPFLPINGNTVSLFRNLVALEQMCPRYGNHFTAYVIFMSQIMCMPSDVAFLVKKGIIGHSLNSDEIVSNQFANLTRSVVFDFSGR